jgi:Transposase DDE domain
VKSLSVGTPRVYRNRTNSRPHRFLRRARKRIEGFLATEKLQHGRHRQPCRRGPLPSGASRVERMKRKLETKAGAAVYALRKTIVEPVFGQIKQGRGFRQFLLRGLEKGRGEWALLCLTHNILKLHKLCYG